MKYFGSFFTWMYNAEDAAVQSLVDFKWMDTPVTMNQLKFLHSLYEPALLQCLLRRHVETKGEHQGYPGPGLYLQEAAVDQLALGIRSGQRHPSKEKYVPLTGK